MSASLTRRSSDGPGRACVTALASVVMTASFQARYPSGDNFGLSRCSTGAMLACAATTLSRDQAPLRTTRGASVRQCRKRIPLLDARKHLWSVSEAHLAQTEAFFAHVL